MVFHIFIFKYLICLHSWSCFFLRLFLAKWFFHLLEGIRQEQALQGAVWRGCVLHRAAAFQLYGRARRALQESTHFYKWARRQALPCQPSAVTFQPKMSLENRNRPHVEPSLVTVLLAGQFSRPSGQQSANACSRAVTSSLSLKSMSFLVYFYIYFVLSDMKLNDKESYHLIAERL